MKSVALLFAVLLLTGCASVPNKNPKDPFESYNRSMYKFNDVLDRNLLKPVAKGYDYVTPNAVKTMLNNFFSNLDDVAATLNDLLQFKFKQAASDGSRVLFNSTFGLFGLFNVTDRLDKHNEDFGQTLGYWGVSSGPYVVLPFFGPSSIRDGVGLYADGKTSVVLNLNDDPVKYGLYATDVVRTRAGVLEAEKTLDDASDRYAFIRDFYMARRQSLVYDGNPPREKYIDEED
jgi:phospholipid-binding lipoprotein MlaA